MSGVATAVRRLAVATLGLAALCALAGVLVAHFGGWTSGLQGVGWGMVVGGGVLGLAAGGSGSPSENRYGGQTGPFATYWPQSLPLPQSPLVLALCGLVVFGGGLAILVLA